MIQDSWKKPVRSRHAYVTQALAEILEGLPKAAIALANHLFRICIAGKPEEIELYTLGIGEKRSHGAWEGKQYAKNTLRAALKVLEKLNIVQIIKDYGKGVFKITVSHPGGERPFDQPLNRSKNLSEATKNLSSDRKIDQTEHSNTDSDVLSYRELSEDTDSDVVKNLFSQEQVEEIANKYERRLYECGIYRRHQPDKDKEMLVDNPKFAPVLKALAQVSVERAERGIKTFLIQSTRRGYDKPYAALKDAILKGWKTD